MYERHVNYAVRFRDAALAEAVRLGMALDPVYAQDETLGSAQELSDAAARYRAAPYVVDIRVFCH